MTKKYLLKIINKVPYITRIKKKNCDDIACVYDYYFKLFYIIITIKLLF